jgi:hypothetical protein
MARIYFDSNVFSGLKNEEQTKYCALKEAIAKYKDNLVFVFSHAHIRDKINDNTSFKFEDFEYMKTLVSDNYLSYHLVEKRTSFYLATPSEVFIDNDSLTDVDFVMNLIGGRSYKELRSLIEKGGKNVKYSIGDEVYILNDLFKDGIIQDKFIDFIKASLHHKDKKNIPYYDFYLHSYNVLDILGFSKDKLNKKNSFNNVFNDSLHSYYAKYCDYFITEDEGLRKKSSLLYKKYEVSTKVLSVEEFLELIDSIGEATENNLIQFFKKLSNDLISGTLVSNTSESDFNIYEIKSSGRYFNFFDSLMVLKSQKNQDTFIFLKKEKKNYLSEPNYKECGLITNRMLKILHEDLAGKGKFDFESEIKEMISNGWNGRYWEIGDTKINLQINEGTREFCVQIGPFSRWLYTSHFK